MIKRALISVYDKQGILELAEFLKCKGTEIISTGGTYKYLKDNGIDVIEISEVTGFPEMLDGRVKTLHPKIHGGLLAIRNNKNHMDTLEKNGIKPIDMVVVNLYPFFEKVKEDLSFEEKIEFIDIGGPTMLRSAAKNFKYVTVVSDTSDYSQVISEIEENGDVSAEFKRKLAGKVFNLTSAYDAAISNFILEDEFPEYLSLSYRKAHGLRYGENPHQKAAYYVSTYDKGAMKNFEKLNGKELSYNNLRDMDIAWKAVWEFDEIACCGLKHNTPCGASLGKTPYEAYVNTYEGDKVSIYGGIVAFNTKVDKKTAEEMAKIFLEIVIAPDFYEDALQVLCKKKNLRVIKGLSKPVSKKEYVSVDGGILIQDRDMGAQEDFRVVTDKQPAEAEIEDMKFGMKIAKYVKSNAIVVVKDKKVLGVGAGQVNRVWAAEGALERGQGARVLVSDAFLPFSDTCEAAAKYGITAIVQPGGSIRDQDSIDVCNKQGISMVFTGVRHFKH